MTENLLGRHDVVPNPIAFLRMNGIEPLDPDAVAAYMEAEAAKYPPSRVWELCNRIGFRRVGKMIEAMFLISIAVVFAGLVTWNAAQLNEGSVFLPLFAIAAGTASGLLSVKLDWMELRGPAEWKTVPYFHVTADNLPSFVQRTVGLVRKTIGLDAKFEVDELIQGRTKLDPILYVLIDDMRIPLVIWNEKGERVILKSDQ